MREGGIIPQHTMENQQGGKWVADGRTSRNFLCCLPVSGHSVGMESEIYNLYQSIGVA